MVIAKRRTMLAVGALLLALLIVLLMLAQPVVAQRGPGGPSAACGGGMMGGGWGPGGPWSGGGQPGASISMDQAIEAAEGYLARLGNPDLVLHEAMEFDCNFYFLVEEQSTGLGAFELLVSRANGAVFPEPGPNMMWNTKYGHMGGGMGYGPMMGGWTPSAPTGEPTVTAEQAGQIAQQWLDQYQPGSTIEHPDAFYGYYTVHTLKDGAVSGMLSVNAYSGQVWYHAWHGSFIGMRELS